MSKVTATHVAGVLVVLCVVGVPFGAFGVVVPMQPHRAGRRIVVEAPSWDVGPSVHVDAAAGGDREPQELAGLPACLPTEERKSGPPGGGGGCRGARFKEMQWGGG